MTFLEIVQKWQQHLQNRNKSKHTIIAYTQDFFDFQNFFIDHKAESLTLENFKTLTPQDIRAWLMFQRKQSKNPRSAVRAVASLKNLTRFLLEQSLIEDHAFFHARSPKITKTLPRPVTVSQAIDITQSIKNISEEPWVGLRDIALMQLLYSVGLRISEALQLNQSAIHQGSFIQVHGKGSKVRQVPLLENVKHSLQAYLHAQPFECLPESPLFYGKQGKRLQPAIAQKALRDFRRMNGLPESLTPHALRHSCASHLMQSSHDLRGIQELLGHASLSSTQIYTQIDEAGLMQSYKAFHPRAKNKK